MTLLKRLILGGLSICLVLYLVTLVGCDDEEERVTSSALNLTYATGFTIEEGEEDCTRLTDGEGQEIYLVPKTQVVPEAYEGKFVVRTPVERIVCLSTTYLCHLRALESLEAVCGVSIDGASCYVEGIKQGLDEGTIEQIAGGMGEPDYERVVALDPDIVFVYTDTSSTSQLVFEKLQELGLPVAICNEWLEDHPLGRMEWMKFFSTFVDKEEEADTYFDTSEQKVQEVMEKVSSQTNKPKTLWGSFSSYSGKFSVPRSDSYTATQVGMAGGDYLFEDLEGTGYASITLEEAYLRGLEAEVWIYSSMPKYTDSLAGVKGDCPQLANVPSIQNERVWGYQAWYWQSVDLTHEVIEDLAAILYPDLYSDHEVRHFWRLP